jgi:hypothetical protein
VTVMAPKAATAKKRKWVKFTHHKTGERKIINAAMKTYFKAHKDTGTLREFWDGYNKKEGKWRKPGG